MTTAIIETRNNHYGNRVVITVTGASPKLSAELRNKGFARQLDPKTMKQVGCVFSSNRADGVVAYIKETIKDVTEQELSK